MRKIVFLYFFLSLSLILKAQTSFTTVVPQQPVVVGESFQVEYIIEGDVNTENIKTPEFENFRVIGGPDVYTSSVAKVYGPQKVKNIVFTLKAIQPGKFIIDGASIFHQKKKWNSNDVFVNVITEKEAERRMVKKNEISTTDYFLRPGEDPYKKIKENLFIKMLIDKKSCFTGEPVMATYKLYSTLQSRSDIVKNPGFYGFSVFDMINLSDKEINTEKVNGKLFDVHTIRKVQLFPLRSGKFTIDPMEIKNKVEFSRSSVFKKTEQQVVEGILDNGNEPEKNDAVYFESEIGTEAVSIDVKPFPVNNKPADFNGATGNFAIAASLSKKELGKNEEGVFEVTIKGIGNFIQLIAPAINWPEGVEVFESSIKDNFDKTVTPLSGYRTFRFPIVCSAKGEKEIPSVNFSYFDIDINRYLTISTSPVKFSVTEEKKSIPIIKKKKNSISNINKRLNKIAASIVIGLVLIALFYWISRKKEVIPEIVNAIVIRPDAEEVLKSATESLIGADNVFYKNLYQSLWIYLAENFNLEESRINKVEFLKAAKQKGVPAETIDKLKYIITACETGQYTNAIPVDDRQMLLKSAKEVISSMELYLL